MSVDLIELMLFCDIVVFLVILRNRGHVITTAYLEPIKSFSVYFTVKKIIEFFVLLVTIVFYLKM